MITMLTFFVVFITDGDGVVTQGHRVLIENVRPHSQKLGRTDESSFVRVDIDTGAVYQQEMSVTIYNIKSVTSNRVSVNIS